MIVCVCNNISSKDILNHISQNKSSSLESLTLEMPCCNQCEVCKFDIQDLLHQSGNKQ